jgi:hypothetical protein
MIPGGTPMMPYELFRRLKPLYPAAIARLWIEYQTADVERKREIDELVTILAIKRLGMMIGDEKLVLDAPPAWLIGEGQFTIGHVSYPGIHPIPFVLDAMNSSVTFLCSGRRVPANRRCSSVSSCNCSRHVCHS